MMWWFGYVRTQVIWSEILFTILIMLEMLKPESYDLKYCPQFWFHTHTQNVPEILNDLQVQSIAV